MPRTELIQSGEKTEDMSATENGVRFCYPRRPVMIPKMVKVCVDFVSSLWYSYNNTDHIKTEYGTD